MFPGTETFRLTNPLLSVALGDTRLEHSQYATFNIVGEPTSVAQGRRVGFCFLGVPTVATDLPIAQPIIYNRFAIAGEAYDARNGPRESYNLNIAGSDASNAIVTVDFNSGRVDFTISLRGFDALGNSRRDLGTYQGQAQLDRTSVSFTGAATAASGEAPLVVNGAFFGPRGRELGLTFTRAQNTSAAPVRAELLITGVLLGRPELPSS
jgi:hypothetical protein